MNKAPFADCEACPLRDKEKFVRGAGPHIADMVFIGESPGAHEENQGIPFVGDSGMFLKNTLRQLGVDPDRCYFTNALLCRPPGGEKEEIANAAADRCRQRLLEELADVHCKSGRYVVLGGIAARVLVGAGKITTIRGRWFPFGMGGVGAKILPTWHPAYILRKPNEGMDWVLDMEKAVKGPPHNWDERQVSPDWEVLGTENDVHRVLGGVNGVRIAYDFETSQNLWFRDRPMLLALAWDETCGYVIPGYHPEAPHNLLEESTRVQQELRELWGRNTFVGHNVKFDQHFGLNIGVDMSVNCCMDTMIAHYCLDERRGTHGLKDLARLYLDAPDYEDEVTQYLPRRSAQWTCIPFMKLAQYAVWDVVNTLELAGVLEQDLRAQGLWEMPFMGLLMPAVQSMFKVERIGMAVDLDYLETAQQQLLAEEEDFTNQLREMCGHPEFNPRSPMQVARVIYDEMGLERPGSERWDLWKGRTKVGPNSTSKGALERFAIKDGNEVIGYNVEFLDVLFRYRRADKILSSYINNLIDYCDEGGRVHPVVYLHGTETGRISIREPALQTIPRETTDKYGELIRNAFVAPPGKVIVICDYSQAELRVFAALTEDPWWIRVYQEGRDIHSEVSLEFYGPEYKKEDRMIVKRFNFGYIYGGGFTILHDSQIPEAAAKRFMAEYKKLMAVAHRWRESQKKVMRSECEVKSPFGRVRRFPVLTPTNVLDAEHAAINFPVQGAASDLNLMAAMELQGMGYDVLLTIHDSILVEVEEKGAEWHMEKIRQVMEDVGNKYFPQVPWKADPEIRKRWGGHYSSSENVD